MANSVERWFELIFSANTSILGSCEVNALNTKKKCILPTPLQNVCGMNAVVLSLRMGVASLPVRLFGDECGCLPRSQYRSKTLHREVGENVVIYLQRYTYNIVVYL